MSTGPTAFPPLSGGVPTRDEDLVPAIVFTVAFAVLLIPGIYRLLAPRSRSLVLIRPLVFCVTQMLAYGLRAGIAHGSTSTKVYEASEILLLAGLVLICEPVPALLSRVIGKETDGIVRGPSIALLQRVLAILRVVLIVALIMGVLAATDISDHESHATINKIKVYRLANAGLILGAIGGSSILSVLAMTNRVLPPRGMLFMVCICTFIILTAAYKLENTLKPSDNYSRTGKIVFYILNSTCQWLVTALYLAFNLNDLFVDYQNPSGQSNGPSDNSYPMQGKSGPRLAFDPARRQIANIFV